MTIAKPQTFEPDGRAIPFVEEGDGPVVVVLLPGSGLGIASLGALAHFLEEEGFRIVRIGVRRPDGGAHATMHDLAQDVVDVMDHVGIASAFVGGNGFGGALARTIALDHHDRAEGILLLGVQAPDAPAPDVAQAWRSALAATTRDEAPEAISVLAGDQVDPTLVWNVFSRSRDVAADAVQSAALAATPVQEWARLADTFGVLVVQGSDDRVTTPANAEQLRSSAPERVSVVTVAGGGHLFVLTHPGEIGAEIEEYLAWD